MDLDLTYSVIFAFLCLWSLIFDIFFFQFLFYEKFGWFFFNNKLNPHSDLIFLEFKVGRGKVIGGLNLMLLTEIVSYPIVYLWRVKDYFNWKSVWALKKCPIQSTFLMSVLCYADNDFFLFCLMKIILKLYKNVSWSMRAAHGGKADSFSLTQTHQHQSVSLISLKGTSGKLRLNEEAYEIFGCSWFSQWFVL